MQRTLNIVGWIGTAVVFGAVAVRFLKPEWDQYAVYAAWTGLALVVLYTLGQWREIAAWFQRRNARYAAVASLSVLVVLGLLVAVNYLSNRRHKRWDLTANQQYSLSDQSVKLLKGLDAPVKVRVFERSDQQERFKTRLAEYQFQSNNKLTVDYIDPEKHPLEAKQYDVQAFGTLVLEYKGRTEKLQSDNEQDVTSGLMKLLNPSVKKVYFLSGHGEKDTASSDRLGYSGAADALKADNYQFDKLVLAQTNMIPDDATGIVIAGPQTDLLENEVTLLQAWLAKGGKLLVLFDPPSDLKKPASTPQLTGLLKEWGINTPASVVVDVSGQTSSPYTAVAAAYPQHVITQNFQIITAFPLARAVTPDTANTKRAAQTFVQTSAASWAETDLSSLTEGGRPEPNYEKGDLKGPVSIAVAVASPIESGDAAKPAEPDAKKPEARVAVVGDSEFATNGNLGFQGNRDLFMNTVNWIAQQESQISIRPRDPADRRITLTERSSVALFWATLVVIPLAVFGAGVFSWWRRR